jgi:hypothetical protein
MKLRLAWARMYMTVVCGLVGGWMSGWGVGGWGWRWVSKCVGMACSIVCMEAFTTADKSAADGEWISS